MVKNKAILLIVCYCCTKTVFAQILFHEKFNDTTFLSSWKISTKVEQAIWLGTENSKYIRFHPNFQNQFIQTPTIFNTKGNFTLFFDWNKVGTNTIDSVQLQVFNNNAWQTIYAVYNGNNRAWQTDSVNFETNQDSLTLKWNYFSSGIFPSQYFNIDNIVLQKNTPTKIQQNKNEITFNIFPNPNNGQFQLKIDNQKNQAGKILMYSSTGTIVYESVLSNTTQSLLQLDVSTFPKGAYILQITNATNLFSKTFIIQ
jgi:hypothetical protein